MAPLKRTAGFTLIELMVVITIIGLLAGLTIAVVGPIARRNQYSAARADIQRLETALNLYYNDCGAYPPTPSEPGNNAEVIAALTGDLDHDKLYNPTSGDLKRGPNWGGPYFQIDKKVDSSGNFLDPWNMPYRYFNNEREDPTCKANPNSYLLYSCGIDRKADDDPRESILNSKSPSNVDNIKNWEDE
ncbi:prepilin-type N-terminal cleavage/methylation domain-containing protein [bacterium]|nr:prepilin-type N-terminal cleavage/methylation domain-containing protein [bacterium]